MFIHVLLIRMHTGRFQTLPLIKKELKSSFLVLEDNDALLGHRGRWLIDDVTCFVLQPQSHDDLQ